MTLLSEQEGTGALNVEVLAMRRVLAGLVMLAVTTGVPQVEARPKRQAPLRFGMYPGNTFTFGKYAGQTGHNAVDPVGELALDRMVELANHRPFDVHMYADWRVGFGADLQDHINRVKARGLRVNLALKYVPPDGHDGDIPGFAAWVAGVVRSHREVDVWQITNEANVKGSPDTDGGATDPLGALIEGVKAADGAKARRQQVGFNWFYRLDPVSDGQFWSTLGSRGGDAFRAAVDYAGVDIYAGTYIPPATVDDEAEFRRALEYVRNEMMPLAGLGPDVPIYVQETGYPTLDPIVRTEARQAQALQGYIDATAGLNVQLLQWFQLADAESSFGDDWGVLRADYSRKPAFDVMRRAARGRGRAG